MRKPKAGGSLPKRIVFVHTQGPYPGLHQIMGLTSDLGAKNGKLPDHAEGFEALGRVIEFASLIKVHPRHAIYQECLRDAT